MIKYSFFFLSLKSLYKRTRTIGIREKKAKQSSIAKYYFSNRKPTVRREISTGEHLGKFYPRSDLDPFASFTNTSNTTNTNSSTFNTNTNTLTTNTNTSNTNTNTINTNTNTINTNASTFNTPTNTNMSTNKTTISTVSGFTNHNSAYSNQATSLGPSVIRGPFVKNSTTTGYTDSQFYPSFSGNGPTETPTTATSDTTERTESFNVLPRNVESVCCGLFELDDGDYDDTLPNYLNPYERMENFVFANFLPLIWAFIGVMLLFLFFFFYGVISK